MRKPRKIRDISYERDVAGVMNELTLPAAVISDVSHRMKEGVITSRLTIRAALTPALALQLGCRELIYQESDGLAKQGFSAMELDTECGACKAHFAIEQLPATLNIQSDGASHFTIQREEDGQLGLKLRLVCHGNPHEIVDYLMTIGEGTAVCTITPLAQRLDLTVKAEENQRSGVVTIRRVQ